MKSEFNNDLFKLSEEERDAMIAYTTSSTVKNERRIKILLIITMINVALVTAQILLLLLK